MVCFCLQARNVNVNYTVIRRRKIENYTVIRRSKINFIQEILSKEIHFNEKLELQFKNNIQEVP